jgi:hypothetical protein
MAVLNPSLCLVAAVLAALPAAAKVAPARQMDPLLDELAAAGCAAR